MAEGLTTKSKQDDTSTATDRISKYVLRYAQTIPISDSVLFCALDLAQDLEGKHSFFISGKSSRGLGAAVVYISSILNKERLTQWDLFRASQKICENDVCRVTEPTIGRLYQDIVKELHISQEPDDWHLQSFKHNPLEPEIITSRQEDVISGMDKLLEAAKLARANSKRDLPKDPHGSPAFPIPDYMNPPQIQPVYDHWVRIWRAPAIPLTKDDFRRCIGLLEFTPLKEDGLTLGLEWFYSASPPPEWEQFPYVLYSHFPGSQPCRDLVDVYHSCSLEIRYAIIKLQGREGLQLYRLAHKNKNGGRKESPDTIADAETGERIA